MSKLHELLAVEGNLKSQADKTRTDLMSTFANKRHLFEQKVVTFQSLDEGSEPVREEQKDIQSTIIKELRWISPFLIKAIDTSYQVAEANTAARADVVTEDGLTLMTGVPATALLELEKRCKEIHDFLKAVPTLDPAKGFSPDPDMGPDIYRARDVEKNRTKKDQRPLTLAKATEKHAEQVQLIVVDVVVGKIREQEWSGLVTPTQKGEMLERCEVLLRAVRKARARANEVEVKVGDLKVADKLVSFVFGVQ